MSKIGKKPIVLPSAVKIQIEEERIKVSGPQGEAFFYIPRGFLVELKENIIYIRPQQSTKEYSALWGTTRANLNNVINGVLQKFEKKLEIEGVGYRAEIQEENLILKLGYINPVILKIPENIQVKVEKNIIVVTGISKEAVGQFAALIRSQKPPEPYKGKGIHYLGEKIRRKAGKKLATASSV